MQVSVIIPIYNTKIEDLNQCIASIFQQTLKDFEIILVDDGSNVQCHKLLDQLAQKDERIRVIHKKNEGVSVARNLGVAQARGEYIMFVDGDDMLTPWALESGVYFIKKLSADVIVGKVCSVDIRPNQYSTRIKEPGIEILDSEKIRLKFVGHILGKNCERWQCDAKGWEFNGEGCWAHLMKKSVAEQLLFVPGMAVGEDTIWALQMLDEKYAFRICLVDELWYYYIQNDYSVLNKYNPNIIEQLSMPVRVLDKVYGTQTGFLYESYIDWVLIKLKQICFRAYLSDECAKSNKNKVRDLTALLKNEPWHEILSRKTKLPIKKNIKLWLYRRNLMLYIYMAMKKYRHIAYRNGLR